MSYRILSSALAIRLGILAAALALAACAISIDTGRTRGERFRAQVASLEAECKANPPRRGETRCDLLKVEVEDWFATPEGRYAHSIEIPNPVPADSGYRPGMTQNEYFDHLCKTEAGEFIFKTVDNVEGIRLLRPRTPVRSTYKFMHLHSMEDPYGHDEPEAEEPGFQLLGEVLYSYIEMPKRFRRRDRALVGIFDASMFSPPPSEANVEIYYGYGGRQGSLKVKYETQYQSRYAVTWRGVRRPSDRELGVAGGELIVLDLATREVLGVRRGYALYRGNWEVTALCPRYGYSGGRDKSTGFTFWFVGKVARPPRWNDYFSSAERSRR